MLVTNVLVTLALGPGTEVLFYWQYRYAQSLEWSQPVIWLCPKYNSPQSTSSFPIAAKLRHYSGILGAGLALCGVITIKLPWWQNVTVHALVSRERRERSQPWGVHSEIMGIGPFTHWGPVFSMVKISVTCWGGEDNHIHDPYPQTNFHGKWAEDT